MVSRCRWCGSKAPDFSDECDTCCYIRHEDDECDCCAEIEDETKDYDEAMEWYLGDIEDGEF